MRVFKNESIWDKENGQWVESFMIDGKEVQEDVYYKELENEELVEDDCEQDKQDQCECCNCEDKDTCEDYECTCDELIEENECDCIDCTLDRYVERIQEINGGCPNCIKEVLAEFLVCVVDHIK